MQAISFCCLCQDRSSWRIHLLLASGLAVKLQERAGHGPRCMSKLAMTFQMKGTSLHKSSRVSTGDVASQIVGPMWEVRPFPGRGLGVCAQRDLERGECILSDPLQMLFSWVRALP